MLEGAMRRNVEDTLLNVWRRIMQREREREKEGEREIQREKERVVLSRTLGLPGYSQGAMLGVWCESVNFGGKRARAQRIADRK